MKRQEIKETTILVDVADKRRLDAKKVHKREPYREVFKRVLDDLEREEHASESLTADSSKHSTRIEELIDRTVVRLNSISKGRLANWTPKNRSHERLIHEQAKAD